ncbi:MAG: hypothetical protein J5I90_00085 [Caldilineales bacterium]|nr:hypothetical protein [Caldilineales bacterium]
MYDLAEAFPAVRRVRLPITRDQAMLLIVAFNMLILGVDIFLAHSISGTIVPREWIPIVFGPVAALLLVLAGFLANRNRDLASLIATLTLLASILIGLLGAYFHLVRAALPAAPWGQKLSIDLLVWAPPVVGPLMFIVVGILGISAAWIEDPPDSGTLVVFRGARLHLPYSKTRAYFYIVGMAALATVFTSVYDHARTGFENPYLWIPTIVGIFATVAGVALGAIRQPSRSDLHTYVAAMALMLVVGALGFLLHIESNIPSDGTFVIERFIRGAPFLAPLLFCNVGLLGFIALLDPVEQR